MYRPDNGMIVISVIKKLSWIFEKYITREYGINNIHGKRITNSNATVWTRINPILLNSFTDGCDFFLASTSKS